MMDKFLKWLSYKSRGLFKKYAFSVIEFVNTVYVRKKEKKGKTASTPQYVPYQPIIYYNSIRCRSRPYNSVYYNTIYYCIILYF